eukprot:scaffold3299_cov116-Isochrysis_galbana.AAC.16
MGASTIDRTYYGRASASPPTYMQHHSQRLSRAAVMADAKAICKKVLSPSNNRPVSSPVSPPLPLPRAFSLLLRQPP